MAHFVPISNIKDDTNQLPSTNRNLCAPDLLDISTSHTYVGYVVASYGFRFSSLNAGYAPRDERHDHDRITTESCRLVADLRRLRPAYRSYIQFIGKRRRVSVSVVRCANNFDVVCYISNIDPRVCPHHSTLELRLRQAYVRTAV